jgi:hypothetical protein
MLFTVNERVISYKTWLINKICFSVSVFVSFFLFPCSKGQVVRAYLDTILMTLAQSIYLNTLVTKVPPFVKNSVANLKEAKVSKDC